MVAEPPPTNWPQVNDLFTCHHDTYPAITPDKADLSGRSVLITGASKGIGRMTALRFAAAGCSKIAIAARSPLSEVEAAVLAAAAAAKRPPPQVLSLSMDVTSEESVGAAAEKLSTAFGGALDILINNAGYLEKWNSIPASEPAEWWRSWEVNIKGTYLVSRAFMPLVAKSDRAGPRTVINLSSAGGHNILPGASAYQTTKFTIARLTEFMASEGREDDIVAMSIHPGGVKTELAENMPEFMHAILIDSPELPADAMVWLVKEKREWLSGRWVSVCWDVEEMEARKAEIVEKDLLKFRMVI